MVYDWLSLYAVEEERSLVGVEDITRSEGSSRWQWVGQSILHSETLSKIKLHGVHIQWNLFAVLRSEQYNNGSVERLSVEIMCTEENYQNINGECPMDTTDSHVNIQTWASDCP